MKLKISGLSIIILLFIFAGCGQKEEPKPVTVTTAVETFFFKVQFSVGDVKIASMAGEKPAAQGDQLKTGDIITTGKNSVADLLFGTSGVVRIKENSRVTISSIADKTNNDTVMNMDNGKVYLTLSKLKGTGFRVKTPTAVAGVRGTSFTVESDKKGAKLSVVKGIVAVNPVKNGKVIEDKTVEVETGNKTGYIDKKSVEKIIQGKMKIPVMKMTPAEKIEVQAEVQEIKVENMPEISLELKEEIKKEIAIDTAADEKKEEKKGPVVKKGDDKAAAKRKLEEERKMKEQDEKRIAEEKKQKEEQLKREAAEKKIKEEKQKKERASNIPTM